MQTTVEVVAQQKLWFTKQLCGDIYVGVINAESLKLNLNKKPCSILSTHSGGHKEFCIVGYSAVRSVESHTNECYLLHPRFLLGLFFDTEDGADTCLRNVR
jgi:hypothetical protein